MEVMINEIEKGGRMVTAVGSGGSMTYQVVREHEATFGSSLLRPLAGAMAATIAAFAAPPAAGGALVVKGRSDNQQSAQWVLEHAVQAYGLEVAPSAPWKDQILRIKDVLQLTVGDLARFAGVERPSVYHWLTGSRPRPAKQRRIDVLENLAGIWSGQGLGPIRAFLSRTVGDSNDTLEALLTQTDLNFEAIEAHVRALSRASGQLARPRQSISDRLGARGFKPTSKETYRRQRDRFVQSTSSGEE